MLKIVNLVFLLVLLQGLTACASTKVLSDEEKDNNKTAKINAQLGMAYLEQHDVQRAKHKFLMAVDEGPNIPETWYSLAYFYEATGNNAEANQYYLKSISVTPQRGDAHNNYGTFLCRTGHYSEAVKQFLIAVHDSDYLNPADAYENAGLCELKVPNRKLAYEYFNRAIMEDTKRPVSLIKLSQLDYDKGNYKSSRQHLKQFLAISAPTEQSTKLSEKLKQKLGDLSETKEELSLLDKPYQTNKTMDDVSSKLKKLA